MNVERMKSRALMRLVIPFVGANLKLLLGDG